MKVKNQKCIRRLSYKSLWATRKRNVIAIFAIALTSVGGQRSWTTLACVSPVTVIASEPCS